MEVVATDDAAELVAADGGKLDVWLFAGRSRSTPCLASSTRPSRWRAFRRAST
jgi:hypothetical protein